MSVTLSTEARIGMGDASRPNGVRVLFPVKVLAPPIDDEPEDAYAQFLVALSRGAVLEDEIDLANEYSWFGRYKEYAQAVFFLEAAATCYEMLVKARTVSGPVSLDKDGNYKGLVDLKRTVDAFKSLTGQSISDVVAPDDD